MRGSPIIHISIIYYLEAVSLTKIYYFWWDDVDIFQPLVSVIFEIPY